MNITSPNFLGEIDGGASQLVRLNSAGGFNSVKISWFTRKNSASDELSLMNLNSARSNEVPLLTQSGQWKDGDKSRPSILKVQFVGTNNNIDGRDYNYSNPLEEDKSGSRATLLYPVKDGVNSAYFPSL